MEIRHNQKRMIMCIMFFLGMIFLLAGGGILAGRLFDVILTGPIFMAFFALCFFALAFWSKKKWWAIIPGGLFTSGGLAAALDIIMPGNRVAGPAFLFLMAATFFLVVIFSKQEWWAIIPGGIFFSIGCVAVLESFFPHKEYYARLTIPAMGVYIWVLILGLAATFGALWLMRKTQPTHWAKYPAVGLLAIAILAFLLGSHFQEAWLASMVLGMAVMFLLRVFSGDTLELTQLFHAGWSQRMKLLVGNRMRK